ncbi:inosine/guanosine kinase [Celerinatantimonas yamalensis]|uniref:Inosine/guanosine kinase n=1 Tax=Celerinatantimonas yamalensis TaxID=559956 RepID=A0ABW9G2P0_9GAMM
MKFPGRRKTKHYFPVSERDPLLYKANSHLAVENSYIVGIDQVMVDIEATVSREFITSFGLPIGESSLLEDEQTERLVQALAELPDHVRCFAGGTVANTTHNYSVLADSPSYLLGVMSESIQVGSFAYQYLCNTSSKVNLQYLQPVDGPIGRCFTLISEDGQRTFGISKGKMNCLQPEAVSQALISKSCALLISAYLVRTSVNETIMQACMKAIDYAHQAKIPVVLTLGTQYLIAQDPTWWQQFVREHVDILAMNEQEACALTGESDPLRAVDIALESCDLVLCTAGEQGLYMGGYCDSEALRQTRHPLCSDDGMEQFNYYEFSRAMRACDCSKPKKIYSHIAPYLGGPQQILNTNGAGDGALAAILHDIVANRYHRLSVPQSAKHAQPFLTYSSLSQICKYANRVSYDVLIQSSPRLSRGLPEREDSLEEGYWAI